MSQAKTPASTRKPTQFRIAEGRMLVVSAPGRGSWRGVTETTSIDVERARAETPGCAHVVHLNNAGSSLPPRPVLDAVVVHLELEARIGGYEAHAANEQAIQRFYGAAA